MGALTARNMRRTRHGKAVGSHWPAMKSDGTVSVSSAGTVVQQGSPGLPQSTRRAPGEPMCGPVGCPGSKGGPSLRSEGEDALERWVRQRREQAATAAHGPPRDGKAAHVEAARERRAAARVLLLERLDRIEQGTGSGRRHVVERRVCAYRHRQVATDRARTRRTRDQLSAVYVGLTVIPTPKPGSSGSQSLRGKEGAPRCNGVFAARPSGNDDDTRK